MLLFPHAERTLLLGLLLAVGGGAQAQQAAPAAPAAPTPAGPQVECAAPPELLEVRVGSEGRGSFAVRRASGGWLVEPGALRESERGYASGNVTCPDGDFVRLREDLNVTYDGAEQQLVISPAARLLTSGQVDAGGPQRAAPVQTRALASVGSAVDVRANWRTGDISYGAVLEGGYAQGAWEARAAVGVGGEGGAFGVRVRAGVAWQVNEAWVVRAGWNSALPEASGALVTTDFKGVQVEGRSGEVAVLPPLDLDLPLTSRVTVFLNDTILSEFDANPGRVTIRNLPRVQSFGVLNVFIDDASGRRVVNVPFGTGPGAQRAGEFQVRARAGVEGGRPSAAFLGTVAVTPTWTVTGSGDWKGGGELSLRAGGATTLAGGALGVGASVTRSGEGALGGAFEVSYARAFGAWSLGAGLSVPLPGPLHPRVNLSALYFTPAWTFGTSLAYDARGGTLGGNLSASAPLTRNVTLGGRIGYESGRWRAGATLGWKPSSALDVSASAGLGAGAEFGVGARYQLTPGQVAWAQANQNEVTLGYSRDAPARIEVAAGTGGSVAARVSGSVLLTGQGALVVPEAARRGVLIRTGVPGLTLRTGAGTVRTDAAGDAVAFGRDGETAVNVSVDVDALPFNITVGEDAATLALAGNGLAVLDWRANFTVSRWVRVFWAPGEPAGGALLVVGGRTWRADRDGWVLLDGAPQDPRGELRAPEPPRTCAITVPPTGENAVCEAGKG
ncbi:hypothetical protein [Deinococcus aestuarii]|uniref:hypothetical protein n=1 Tax=Deinococcus aestuarii TaxID=2774531 RepID=UPI001C0ABB7C|nr:hypothetical protein [Deinococcus aestuarii]